jgi:hypothetical protein
VIDFRYHVVSLVAVLLALATGIVVGTSLLNQPLIEGLEGTTRDLTREKEDLRRQVTGLEGEVEFRDSYLTSVTPALTSERLSGATVLLVTLPEAEKRLADAVNDTLTGAGATVTARAAVRPEFFDQSKERMLGDLAGRLAVPGVSPASGQPYALAARQLAASLVTSETSGPRLDAARTALIAGLDEAGYVEVTGTPERLAELVVVVGGANLGSADGTQAEQAAAAARTGDVVVALVDEFDQAGRGTVVAGPPASAGQHGAVGIVRDDDAADAVSTVDTATSPFGRVAVVYALIEQLRGGAGQYGIAGSADQPLPDLTRSSTS